MPVRLNTVLVSRFLSAWVKPLAFHEALRILNSEREADKERNDGNSIH